MARANTEAVFDTSILVDYLTGRDEAKREFDRYSRRAISILTWMELQNGSRTEEEADVIDLFLREFRVIEVNRQVSRRANEIRRKANVPLPAAIIWASAQLESAPLVTSNRKVFPAKDPSIRIPY
jgi:predicted nucleic acid-binding protein